MQSEEFADQVLGLLVNFANQMDAQGLLPELPDDAEGSKGPAVPKDAAPCPGASAKAGPPLPPEALRATGCDGAEASSSSSGCQARPPPMMAPTSKFAPGLPSAPPDYGFGNNTKGRLVCHPEQMKQFLYGNTQKARGAAPSGSESMILI